MPSPETDSPRVPFVDPHEVALSFVRQCVEHVALGELGPVVQVGTASDDALMTTPLYKRVLQLAEYAVHGKRPRSPVDKLVAPLDAHARSPLWERIGIDEVVASADPQRRRDAAVKLVLVAAYAREKLDENLPLTTTDLAVLAGISRSAVLQAYDKGELERVSIGKPGHQGTHLVAAKDAHAWLESRSIEGVKAGTRRTKPR
jgi:hypothetical protein